MPVSVLDPALLRPQPTWWYQNMSYWIEWNGRIVRVVQPETVAHALQRLTAQ